MGIVLLFAQLIHPMDVLKQGWQMDKPLSPGARSYFNSLYFFFLG